MQIEHIIEIIAIITSPVVAVLVGQYLQNRERRRADKMEIFRTLMIDRGMGWSMDRVKALNVIEVVFCDDKKVLDQWKVYYDKLCVENPSAMELIKIKSEGDKLLDIMAKSLGYKNQVTWETIQNPYIPKGLTDNVNQQQLYQNAQMSVISMMNRYMQNMNDEKDTFSQKIND